MMTTIQTERTMTAHDRCDSCNAQGWVIATFVTGVLTFCYHHFNKYEHKIREAAYHILDEREHINTKPDSSSD